MCSHESSRCAFDFEPFLQLSKTHLLLTNTHEVQKCPLYDIVLTNRRFAMTLYFAQNSDEFATRIVRANYSTCPFLSFQRRTLIFFFFFFPFSRMSGLTSLLLRCTIFRLFSFSRRRRRLLGLRRHHCRRRRRPPPHVVADAVVLAHEGRRRHHHSLERCHPSIAGG